jgi:methylenetetrahydrofolate reductase (NADPH)
MVAHISASHVSGRYRCPVVPHLTAVGHTRDEIRSLLADHLEVGVGDLLALAGDPRPGEPSGDFRYAADLVEFVRSETDLSVGVAAFPELHPASPDRATDRRHLAAKLDMADFGITQFFFDPEDYRRMADELADLGCTTPVLAGVIPVTNPGSVKRFAKINGTRIPVDLWNRLEAADADERLSIACDQAASMVADLVEQDVAGIHLYTLNVPEAVEGVLDRLGNGYFSSAA